MHYGKSLKGYFFKKIRFLREYSALINSMHCDAIESTWGVACSSEKMKNIAYNIVF